MADNRKEPAAKAQNVPDEETKKVMPTPPDGGWGWVVVFGCFMIHVLADGTAYSFGVLILELLDYFPEAGRGELGWIPSIMVGVTWLTGLCSPMSWVSPICSLQYKPTVMFVGI